MTAMELQQWKQNFIRDYLDEIESLEAVSYTHLTLPTTE